MSYHKQLRTVMLIELGVLAGLFGFAYLFWASLCPGLDFKACLGSGIAAPGVFFAYSLLRPLTATPLFMISMMAGDAFGPFLGAIMAALGASLSCMLFFLPAKYLGKIYVKTFLATNLPSMWKLMRTQDYKVVMFTRLVPIFPFDLFSILYGVADFRFKSVLIAGFIGALPECFIFAAMIDDGASRSLIRSTLASVTTLGLMTVVPLLAYEYISRKRGSSLWSRLKSAYRELVFEIRSNNEVIPKKKNLSIAYQTPVILVYGFFSSRRSLTVMERILEAKGFRVLSFNLGGLFGVFFTKGINETASFIDKKIRKQMERQHFEKVHIVAHSKGGLVALWWILRLGGSKYCDSLITMGTPYRGSIYTYLALITPLGFFWKDVWQMRPGSEFLEELHNTPVPSSIKIYCLYSESDRVASGRKAVFSPHSSSEMIVPVPMSHIGHFEFLYKREVGEMICYLLQRVEKSLALKKLNAAGLTEDASEAPDQIETKIPLRALETDLLTENDKLITPQSVPEVS